MLQMLANFATLHGRDAANAVSPDVATSGVRDGRFFLLQLFCNVAKKG
jgi:hypothetical protein